MIERCQRHQCPAMPKSNAERWAARKPLYDLIRNTERQDQYERDREELLSQAPEYTQ